jgi:hypothetical protein
VRTAVLLLAAVFPLCAVATPAGISGFSGKGGSSICTSCHTGGTAPTVALTGPATLVAGMTGNYTFTITGGPGINSGLDVGLGGANSGTAAFTAGPGTKLLNGEVVHSVEKVFAAGSAVFTFSVKAPLTAGVFTLTAAGLSSNDNNDPAGDGAAMAMLDVNVTLTSGAPPVGMPDAGGIPAPVLDAGSGTPGTPPVTPAPTPTVIVDGGAPPKDLLPMSNGNRYNPAPQSIGVIEGESGCNSAGGMPMVVLVALLGGALLIRSSRRTKAAAQKS